jgi:hypothetical protein
MVASAREVLWKSRRKGNVPAWTNGRGRAAHGVILQDLSPEQSRVHATNAVRSIYALRQTVMSVNRY